MKLKVSGSPDNAYNSLVRSLLRPPFRLPESGLYCEVVLIWNIISLENSHLGLPKTGRYSEVVLILHGHDSIILLY